jgi:uncharacterized protein YjlB
MNVESLVLPEQDWVPNNPKLPAVICHGVADLESCEETLSI